MRLWYENPKGMSYTIKYTPHKQQDYVIRKKFAVLSKDRRFNITILPSDSRTSAN
jgi:hypothetical protein